MWVSSSSRFRLVPEAAEDGAVLVSVLFEICSEAVGGVSVPFTVAMMRASQAWGRFRRVGVDATFTPAARCCLLEGNESARLIAKAPRMLSVSR